MVVRVVEASSILEHRVGAESRLVEVEEEGSVWLEQARVVEERLEDTALSHRSRLRKRPV